MKIPFSIEYRPQIESGEYKVVNRIGEEVRIICWDGPDEDYPIVAFSGEDRTPFTWGEDGRFMTGKESGRDLFIITPEPELSEFEQEVRVCVTKNLTTHIKDGNGGEMSSTVFIDAGTAKKMAAELLELAKKELCNGCSKCLDEYWRGRKEAMEEASRGFHYTGPAIPTYFPPCFLGGPCTNPMGDCINCPRQSTDSITTATGTSTAKLEG